MDKGYRYEIHDEEGMIVEATDTLKTATDRVDLMSDTRNGQWHVLDRKTNSIIYPTDEFEQEEDLSEELIDEIPEYVEHSYEDEEELIDEIPEYIEHSHEDEEEHIEEEKPKKSHILHNWTNFFKNLFK